MDEYNQGWDPDVRDFFRKILNCFSLGALWLLGISTLGLFLKLAFIRDGVRWYNIVFYVVFLASLSLLLRYFYRVWRRRP